MRGGRIRMHDDVATLHRTLLRVRLRWPEGRKEEARPGAEVRWVMRGESAELRPWAMGAGADLLELEPLSVAEAALAYLSPEAPPETPAHGEVAA